MCILCLFGAGERGSTVLSTRPSILFCDLTLAPGETHTCKSLVVAVKIFILTEDNSGVELKIF